jgi:opacity protein-like surface antigen
MRIHTAVFPVLLLAACGAVAAQSVPGEASLGKTDVALNLYGAFTPKVSNDGASQSPSNSAGGMVELRHIANPILGFEGTYSFNRADQHYSSGLAITCPIGVNPCAPPAEITVKSNAHELTLDWVPSIHFANVRPFGVLGLGVLLNVPSGGQMNTQTATKAVYVYGAGLDWGLLPHLGLRLQYRGNLYNAPRVSTLYTSIDKFTQTSEPMIGVYLRL